MNKVDLKYYIKETLLLEPWEINDLVSGQSEYEEEQQLWDGLKQESKDLIETYARAFYNHRISGNIFSSIFEKLNKYELNYNDNNDYVDNNGNIKFTSHDYLNVNFDEVVNTIAEYEFME